MDLVDEIAAKEGARTPAARLPGPRDPPRTPDAEGGQRVGLVNHDLVFAKQFGQMWCGFRVYRETPMPPGS